MTSPGRAGKPVQPGRSPRPHVNGRIAVLALVLCAIALSLAYPVREYISERRQIDQLQAQHQQLRDEIKLLRMESKQLANPSYIELLARDRLHMCLPNQMCYVIIDRTAGGAAASVAKTPWYERLWSSVRQADSSSVPAHSGKRPHGSG